MFPNAGLGLALDPQQAVHGMTFVLTLGQKQQAWCPPPHRELGCSSGLPEWKVDTPESSTRPKMDVKRRRRSKKNRVRHGRKLCNNAYNNRDNTNSWKLYFNNLRDFQSKRASLLNILTIEQPQVVIFNPIPPRGGGAKSRP